MQIVLVMHNLLRWGVVLFGLWTLINSLTGVFSKRGFNTNDNRSSLLFMVFCDIQLLVGLILYFNNSWFDRLKDLGNNMKDPYNRFFTMEHLSLMLVAWILVHVGRSAIKRASTSGAKHQRMLLFFGIAILLILVSIPWPFREIIGKPYFRFFS